MNQEISDETTTTTSQIVLLFIKLHFHVLEVTKGPTVSHIKPAQCPLS